ncbi:MAG: Holliday junction ATP-dependent DNA helicase RuvA [Hyphomonas sp. TMED17]|nr:MAG: Holliday junction ATP-dependent DNA helicase RuvA [Hyphomonas sp. TMED17]
MIIGRLKGEIAAIGLDTLIIDVGGVGYVAQAGSRLLATLAPNDIAELFIETRVTENSITLFAFGSDQERAWFVRLQDVPGVAGKSALALVDALTPAELLDALALSDVTAIMRAKGVGKKLAERIIGELAGKPPPLARFGVQLPGATLPAEVTEHAAPIEHGARAEAVSALTNLGYSHGDASRAVAKATQDNPAGDLSELIKLALKKVTQP